MKKIVRRHVLPKKVATLLEDTKDQGLYKQTFP
jgi:hypothetical protein